MVPAALVRDAASSKLGFTRERPAIVPYRHVRHFVPLLICHLDCKRLKLSFGLKFPRNPDSVGPRRFAGRTLLPFLILERLPVRDVKIETRHV
jgi:hypothetical protein